MSIIESRMHWAAYGLSWESPKIYHLGPLWVVDIEGEFSAGNSYLEVTAHLHHFTRMLLLKASSE